jgi:SAM-dependent methyltransferase
MVRPPSPAEIEGARAYEALFVPALFGEWAPRMADAARVGHGQRVLDVASGTGVLARELASRVGSAGNVTGIDAAPGMLAVARELAPAVSFHHGMAESLPFADASFDAVLSQFGLMFFDDRVRALREMRRVAAPRANLAIAVWGSLERNPVYATIVALLEQTAGRAASDALRAPFALGEPETLAPLLTGSNMASARIATHRGTARFPSIRVMVEAEVRGWLPLCGIVLDDDTIAAILGAAESALAPHRASDGRVVFDVAALLVTAQNG